MVLPLSCCQAAGPACFGARCVVAATFVYTSRPNLFSGAGNKRNILGAAERHRKCKPCRNARSPRTQQRGGTLRETVSISATEHCESGFQSFWAYCRNRSLPLQPPKAIEPSGGQQRDHSVVSLSGICGSYRMGGGEGRVPSCARCTENVSWGVKGGRRHRDAGRLFESRTESRVKGSKAHRVLE